MREENFKEVMIFFEGTRLQQVPFQGVLGC